MAPQRYEFFSVSGAQGGFLYHLQLLGGSAAVSGANSHTERTHPGYPEGSGEAVGGIRVGASDAQVREKHENAFAGDAVAAAAVKSECRDLFLTIAFIFFYWTFKSLLICTFSFCDVKTVCIEVYPFLIEDVYKLND